MNLQLPFKTLPELFQYFDHEDKARTFLEKMRWPDGVIVCPSCGIRGAYRNGDCKTYHCRDMACKTKFSVTVGTLMENTKLPLAKWFGAIWLITAHKKGISSHQLARDLGIGQKAAWFLLHRIREMVIDKAPELLNGIVSTDETYIGGRWANMNKSKRTRLQEEGKETKVAVMGMMEREGKVKMTLIGNSSFKDIVRQNVDTGAILVTDEHNGYKGLEKEYNGHVTINHSQLEFIRDGFTTNNIEGAFSLFKRMVLGIYHQISPYHLQAYCNEATYRYNTRKIKDVERFVDAMKKTKGRLRWKDLVMPKPPKTPNGRIEFINGDIEP